MTAKLYEISNDIQRIIDKSEDNENYNLQEELDKLTNDFNDKACSIGLYMKSLDSNMHNIDARIEELKARKNELGKKQDKLQTYLLMNMDKVGVKKASNEFVDVSRRTSYRTNIIDETKIPDSFKKSKTVYSIDKRAIREELDQGVVIEGAELQKNDYVMIK